MARREKGKKERDANARTKEEPERTDSTPENAPEEDARPDGNAKHVPGETPSAEQEDAASEADFPESNDGDMDADGGTSALESQDPNQRIRLMMNRNFIEYASYVIKDRAIPDVDDGLKPVQRRILWTLFLHDNGTYHKVAGIVGAVMQFHPHGDASIYEALVNLANKDVFIDKQGSFGSVILGTPAAAARYIECRLTPLAREVLFNRAITELVDSYDGRNQEPVRLPSKIPTLLLMGADGIALGTRSNVMPHNFNELLRAQISILRDEPFQIYPDFQQGGLMDVSDWQDGLGKVVVRARLEIDGRNINIREIPPLTTTAKLMDSIEAAVNKNKIKIASFHDYTAGTVNIQLSPLRGYDPHKALNALYAYTDCQMNVFSRAVVIMDNRPVRMSTSDILRRNTSKLLEYLKWELELQAGACLFKMLARTLERIFIEEGIYKRIEKCKSRETMVKEVRTGLAKFKDEWLPLIRALYENMASGPHVMPMSDAEKTRMEQLSQGTIPDAEIDRLVEIPIRRIAAFELDKCREEVDLLGKELDKVRKNLKRIKAYAIKYLEDLLARYGSLFPRRTEICLNGFEKIDKSEVALNNIRVGWDKKNCYIGTSVKSDDVVVCNEFDHLLCIERTGEYKVINIPEKIFVDRLFEFRKYDKSTVFGVVYTDRKTGKVYCKRTIIDKFITDKEYRIIPEGCRLEVVTPRPNSIYEIKVDTPIRAKQTQQISLMDAPIRAPKAGGVILSQRKLLKITFQRLLDEDEPTPNEERQPPDLPSMPPPPVPEPKKASDSASHDSKPESVPGDAVKEPAKTERKPIKFSASPPPVHHPSASAKERVKPNDAVAKPEVKPNVEREEDDWNVQPDLGI